MSARCFVARADVHQRLELASALVRRRFRKKFVSTDADQSTIVQFGGWTVRRSDFRDFCISGINVRRPLQFASKSMCRSHSAGNRMVRDDSPRSKRLRFTCFVKKVTVRFQRAHSPPELPQVANRSTTFTPSVQRKYPPHSRRCQAPRKNLPRNRVPVCAMPPVNSVCDKSDRVATRSRSWTATKRFSKRSQPRSL